jgi:hypothetical protein
VQLCVSLFELSPQPGWTFCARRHDSWDVVGRQDLATWLLRSSGSESVVAASLLVLLYELFGEWRHCKSK